MVGMKLTYGLELEWADVDRHMELPVGKWSNEDYTIVNSDGHANCPTGTTWRWGGEINTDPTDEIAGQIVQVSTLRQLLNPTINYRCNLHVHVGIQPLTVDVAKQLLRYIVRWEGEVYPRIEPIPKPTPDEYPDPEAFAGAMKRYRRRKVSHQQKLPALRIAEALRAKDMKQFYEAHAPLGKNGQRLWPVAPRPGMNTRSLYEHGTVEFRHFPGSCDLTEIAEALYWCDNFVRSCFDNVPPAGLWEREWAYFPKFRPYDHQLELRYQETKHK